MFHLKFLNVFTYNNYFIHMLYMSIENRVFDTYQCMQLVCYQLNS